MKIIFRSSLQPKMRKRQKRIASMRSTRIHSAKGVASSIGSSSSYLRRHRSRGMVQVSVFSVVGRHARTTGGGIMSTIDCRAFITAAATERVKAADRF
ncbi:MAG: hypothetical protein AAEJ65_05590 [Planctomycetota bacterium]